MAVHRAILLLAPFFQPAFCSESQGSCGGTCSFLDMAGCGEECMCHVKSRDGPGLCTTKPPDTTDSVVIHPKFFVEGFDTFSSCGGNCNWEDPEACGGLCACHLQWSQAGKKGNGYCTPYAHAIDSAEAVAAGSF